MTGADRFAAVLAKADAAKAALEAAQGEMDEAAQIWAREEVLAYSKAHPRRLITFCAAMGTTTLTVEAKARDFDFSDRYPVKFWNGQTVPTPAFMTTLWKAAEAHGLHNIGSNLLFKAKGGEVVADKHDW